MMNRDQHAGECLIRPNMGATNTNICVIYPSLWAWSSLVALALLLLRLLFELLLMVIVVIISRIPFGSVQCLLAWCFQTNKVMLQFQHSLSCLSRGKNIDTKGLHKLSEIFEQCQRVTVRPEAQKMGNVCIFNHQHWWNFQWQQSVKTFSFL